LSDLASLIERLKQRKLFQWGIAYLAGAWLLLQLLSLLAAPFAWPQLVLRAATVLLAVGFLAVLIIAWYHGEMGKQGTSSTEVMMLAALLVIAAVGVAAVRGGKTSANPGTPNQTGDGAVPRSVAVLPFKDLSADASNEYFSEGITEEILNALAQIPDLEVAARTSSFAFKDKALTIRQIADELNVATVLEGSVRKSGQQLRITAQLVNASNGMTMWSERFDRQLDDVFQIQDEIAKAITRALQVRLGEGPQARAVTVGTANVDAYESYLQGRYHYHRRSNAGIWRAVEHYQQAIRADPNFAAAHAGLADAYLVASTYANDVPADIGKKAHAAALRALQLDSLSAQPHVSLGFWEMKFGWNPPAARRQFERALQLDPKSAQAYQWFSLYFALKGDTAEALRHSRRAELEPLSLIINRSVGRHLYFSRRWSEAERQLKKVLDLDPDFAPALSVLGMVYLQEGRNAEAVAQFERAAEAADSSMLSLGHLAGAYGRAGKREDALRAFASLEERARKEPAPAIYFAIAYTGMGEVERAFDWLRKAEADRSLVHDVYLKSDPWFDRLRSDPRFRAVLATTGAVD